MSICMFFRAFVYISGYDTSLCRSNEVSSVFCEFLAEIGQAVSSLITIYPDLNQRSMRKLSIIKISASFFSEQ